MPPTQLRCPECRAVNRLAPGRPSAAPRCGRCRAPLPWIVEAEDATLERETQVAGPVLVDFWAPWCGPCQTMEPVIEGVAAELAGRLKVVRVNVDDSPLSAARHGVRSIPTLVVYRSGEAVDRLAGLQPRREIHRRLEPHLETVS